MRIEKNETHLNVATENNAQFLNFLLTDVKPKMMMMITAGSYLLLSFIFNSSGCDGYWTFCW